MVHSSPDSWSAFCGPDLENEVKTSDVLLYNFFNGEVWKVGHAQICFFAV